MPSGASEVCGSRPSRRATSFDLYSRMALPSSNTCPAVGMRTRASARSSVDLPHPLGPMMAVNEPSGIATDRPVEMTLLS